MAKNKHKKDKKLHNFGEKLHNTQELDLSWQETVDLIPEDEFEGGSEIYYSVDEDGNVHSREFLAEELIEDSKGLEDAPKGKSRPEKVRRLKSSTTDIVNLVRTKEETPKEIILPVPKPGARPLDVRISSEVTHDLPVKEETWQPSDVISPDKQVIVHLHDGGGADDPAHVGHDSIATSPIFSFTRAVLDQYVAYRNEGLAKKSKDWINRASQALWESTKGEISHQTMTSFRTYVLSKYSSVDAHRKVLGFAAAFLKYMAQVRVDPRYLSFTLFLERPKTIKAKKALTQRIVTREDISAVFQRIAVVEEKGTDASKIRNYRAFTLLALTQDYDRAQYNA